MKTFQEAIILFHGQDKYGVNMGGKHPLPIFHCSLLFWKNGKPTPLWGKSKP
jgi:hypothetical protein